MTIDPDAQAVLDAIAAGKDTAPPKNDAERVERARQDAAALSRFSGPPEPVASIETVEAPGPRGPVPVRLYRPSLDGPLPLLVWMHGGGAIAGSVDGHDPAFRALANRTGWALASVEYRLAPEHRFPAQHEDGMAALEFLARNAGRLGLEAARIAVGGDSVGGLYATTMARLARDRGGPALAGQILLYPNTDLRLGRSYPSLDENEGRIMTRASLRFEIETTVPDADARASPLASPVLCQDPSGLPPALLVTCGADPLRDEGEAYGARLAEAGVPPTLRQYPGMIHAFLQMGGRIAATERLIAEIAAFLDALPPPHRR